MKKLGFIGFGLRGETMLKAFEGIQAPIEVGAVADPRFLEIKEKWGNHPLFQHTVYYESAEEMLEKEILDGVMVGTRCGLHTEFAKLCLAKKIPLFLEKPVCIDKNQYRELLEASQGQRERVVVSFPLRFTNIVQEIKRLADQGEFGNIVTVQAVNNVPYGNVYYHSWYRNEALTGGLFMQKATHDMDYILYILGKRPLSVTACKAKMYFKGDKREQLRCEECEELYTCPESSFVIKNYKKEEPSGPWCCFAKDTGNEDVGAALYSCEDGTIISYHQTFLVKGEAGRRGARFIGTKASAEFDFYTGELRIDYYDGRRRAVHHFTCPEGLVHFGGDEELAKEFLAVMEGKKSRSDLTQGLLSGAVCLGAREAAESGRWVKVEYGF